MGSTGLEPISGELFLYDRLVMNSGGWDDKPHHPNLQEFAVLPLN